VALKVRVAHRRTNIRRARIYVRSAPPVFTRWPVIGNVSSEFGPRNGVLHTGVDILAPAETPILAPAPGTVVFVGDKGNYGITVILRHPESGYETLYSHQSRAAVAVGDLVADGQTLGYVGSTGNATAFHLHFEVRPPDGIAVNPLPLLPPQA